MSGAAYIARAKLLACAREFIDGRAVDEAGFVAAALDLATARGATLEDEWLARACQRCALAPATSRGQARAALRELLAEAAS